MKKLIIVFTVILTLLWQGASSQNLIAVQNGGKPAFYTVLDSAIVAAQSGDTIYLPGGNFSLSVQVSKRLHIIGVGHHMDSILVTGPTRINGNLELVDEASNGSLIGVYLLGSIRSVSKSNYLVQRCRFNGLFLESPSTDWIFVENIIEGLLGGQYNTTPISNCSFYNNIITGIYHYSYDEFTSSVFKNNIFLHQYEGYYYSIKASFSTFENNVFISSLNSCAGVTNSALNNNLFVETNPFCPGCWGSNNILNQPQSTIFVSQGENNFEYGHDYHLKPSSPGKNAGKGGTDIGIYGGFYPWKEGSVPFNPHFQSMQIAPTTDSIGNLNVNIKVSAQDH